MWDNYKLLFYKIYRNRYEANGKSDLPMLTSFLYLSLLMFLNFLSLLLAISLIAKYDVYQPLALNRPLLIVSAGIPLILHYIFIYRNKRAFDELLKQMKGIENEKHYKRFVYFYPVATVAIFVTTLIAYVAS